MSACEGIYGHKRTPPGLAVSHARSLPTGRRRQYSSGPVWTAGTFPFPACSGTCPRVPWPCGREGYQQQQVDPASAELPSCQPPLGFSASATVSPVTGGSSPGLGSWQLVVGRSWPTAWPPGPNATRPLPAPGVLMELCWAAHMAPVGAQAQETT